MNLTFFGENGGVLGVDIYRKNLPWGGKFLGGKYSMENITVRGFDRISIQNSF